MSDAPKIAGEMFEGLKDWSVGRTDERCEQIVDRPGPYMVLLTFEDPETVQRWAKVMIDVGWQNSEQKD